MNNLLEATNLSEITGRDCLDFIEDFTFKATKCGLSYEKSKHYAFHEMYKILHSFGFTAKITLPSVTRTVLN